MIKGLPIKNIKDIKKIKKKYKEKEMYLDLLMFLLVINTGLKMATIFEMKVYQIKGKKYIPIAKGITFLLTNEMRELINIVTSDKEPNDFVFARRIKDKASRYSYYYNFKDICAELGLYNTSIDSWRRTFGYAPVWDKLPALTKGSKEYELGLKYIDNLEHYVGASEDKTKYLQQLVEREAYSVESKARDVFKKATS